MKKIIFLLPLIFLALPFLASAQMHFGDFDATTTNGQWYGMMNWGTGYGMMGYGFLGIFSLISIVWLVVGILAIVWLWQSINKK